LPEASGAQAPHPRAGKTFRAKLCRWTVARDILIAASVVFAFDRLLGLYIPWAKALESESMLWFFMTAPPVVLVRTLLSGVIGLRLEKYLSTGRKRRSGAQIVYWLANAAAFEIPIGGFLLFGVAVHEIPLVTELAPLPSSWLRSLVGQWIIACLILNPVYLVLIKMVVDGYSFDAALKDAGKNLFFINMAAGLFWTIPHLWSLSKESTIETFAILNILALGWGAIIFLITAEDNRFNVWLRHELDRLTAYFPFNKVQAFYADPVALGWFVRVVLYGLYASLFATIGYLAFPASALGVAVGVLALASVLGPWGVPKLPSLIEATHRQLLRFGTVIDDLTSPAPIRSEGESDLAGSQDPLPTTATDEPPR
jgi:hypothetical protein